MSKTNFVPANIASDVLDLFNLCLTAAEKVRVAALASKAASKAAKVARDKVKEAATAAGVKVAEVDLDAVLTADEKALYLDAVKAAETLSTARVTVDGLAERFLIKTQGDRDIKYGLDLRKDFDGPTFVMACGMVSADADADATLTDKAARKVADFVEAVTGRYYYRYKETSDVIDRKDIKDTSREFILAIRDGLLTVGGGKVFYLENGLLMVNRF